MNDQLHVSIYVEIDHAALEKDNRRRQAVGRAAKTATDVVEETLGDALRYCGPIARARVLLEEVPPFASASEPLPPSKIASPDELPTVEVKTQP